MLFLVGKPNDFSVMEKRSLVIPAGQHWPQPGLSHTVETEQIHLAKIKLEAQDQALKPGHLTPAYFTKMHEALWEGLGS